MHEPWAGGRIRVKPDLAGERGGRVPARERVYAHVRHAILLGEAVAGSFLEEEQVSAAVGVSRTPVREAFHQLAAERLVELLPRRGARVREVTARELVELYEVRVVIETHAARSLCEAKAAVPDAMAAAAAEMRRLGDADLERHVRLDHAFHRALVAATRNEVMTEMYDGLRFRQQRVALTAVASEPDRLRTILREHDALAAALAGGDAATAAEVLRRHLRPVPAIVARLPT